MKKLYGFGGVLNFFLAGFVLKGWLEDSSDITFCVFWFLVLVGYANVFWYLAIGSSNR